MSASDVVPSSMGVRHGAPTQETICDGHKEQYFKSGYEAGKKDADGERHLDAMQRARLARGGRGEVDAVPGKFQQAAQLGQFTMRQLLNELRTRMQAEVYYETLASEVIMGISDLEDRMPGSMLDGRREP